jgi:UrcA family protein
MIHYTHGQTAGEMAKRSLGVTWRHRNAQPQPKETAMFRTLMTAAILALTVTAAQAGDTVTVHVGDLDLTRARDAQILDTRVQAAAKTACTLEFGTHTQAIAHNNAVFQSCVKQASKSAMTKYQTVAKGSPAARSQIAGK